MAYISLGLLRDDPGLNLGHTTHETLQFMSGGSFR
jgi:hypothetical protein